MSRLLRNTTLHLAFVLFLGFLLRIWGAADRSLWFDEGASVYFASLGNWDGWASDVHPPLYYVLLHYWMTLGNADWNLRLLSVILGVANIGVVFLLGRLLANTRTGLWAAALLSVYVAHVWYSQEVRMYALLMFLYSLGILGFVVVAKTTCRNIGAGLFLVGTASMFYVQGLGPLYAATLSLAWLAWIIARRNWTEFRVWGVANLIVLALFLPWAGIYLSKVHETASTNYGLSTWIAKPTFLQVILAPLTQTISSIPAPAAMAFPHWAIAEIILGAWWWCIPLMVAIFVGIRDAAINKSSTLVMLITLYVMPLIGVYVASLLLQPIFIVRNVLVISIPLVLLISLVANIQSLATTTRNVILASTFISFLIGTIYLHRYGPNFAIHDEGWDKAAHFLKEHVEKGDLLVVDMENSQGVHLLNRYDPSGVIASMSTLTPWKKSALCLVPQDCMASGMHTTSRQTIWILTAHSQALPNHDAFLTWVKSHTDSFVSHKFNSVVLTKAVWVPSSE